MELRGRIVGDREEVMVHVTRRYRYRGDMVSLGRIYHVMVYTVLFIAYGVRCG